MHVASGVRKFYTRCIAINVSTKTIDTYRFHIERFLKMANISDLSNVTRESLLTFFATMRQQGYAPWTIRGQYVALHTMFKYLYEEGDIPDNPMDRIPKPKIPKEYARTFSVEEISRILGVFSDRNDTLGLRNFAIVSLLFGTGIRKGELLRLTVLDVNIKERIMTVNGKGNKQRIVPLTKSLCRTLKRYIEARGHSFCPFLFLTRDGSGITDGCVMEIFKYIKNELNLSGKRVSPHTVRHTFAKMFLLNGGNLFALQRILGHEDIATTRMYVDYTEKEMNVQMEQCSPLENHRWTYF